MKHVEACPMQGPKSMSGFKLNKSTKEATRENTCFKRKKFEPRVLNQWPN